MPKREVAGVSLRPVGRDDEAFLREVFTSTRPDIMGHSGLTEAQKKGLVEMQFNAQDSQYRANYPGAEFMVIEHKGQGVGRLYIHRLEKEIRIMDIAILPEFRGEGMGTLILNDLIDESIDSKRVLTIHVEKNNPAMSLYERLGFEAEKEVGLHIFMSRRPAANND